MFYNGAASEELIEGWPEIAKAVHMSDVPLKKVRAIAARDSWPIYREGYRYYACPKDLVEHIRELAKSRSGKSADPVMTALAELSA